MHFFLPMTYYLQIIVFISDYGNDVRQNANLSDFFI